MLHTMLRNNGTNIYYITHVNAWESMGKPCSCMQFIKSHTFYCKLRENSYQYYKSRENPYQVLQVTHAVSEHAMNREGSYDKIITTIAPSYTKNITR